VLKAQIGTLVTVRCLQRGDILIQTDNPTYATMLQKMESLVHVEKEILNCHLPCHAVSKTVSYNVIVCGSDL